jgi:hypothetical protein
MHARRELRHRVSTVVKRGRWNLEPCLHNVSLAAKGRRTQLLTRPLSDTSQIISNGTRYVAGVCPCPRTALKEHSSPSAAYDPSPSFPSKFNL